MAAVRKNQRWQHYRSTKNITIDGMGGALGMIMYGWAGKIQFNQKALLLMAVQHDATMIIYGGSHEESDVAAKNITIDGSTALAMIIYGGAGKFQLNQKKHYY